TPLVALCALFIGVSLTLFAQESTPSAKEVQAWQLAQQRYFQNDWTGAVADLSAFLKEYPASALLPNAYLQLGQAYAQLARDQEARQAYAAILEINADDNMATQAVSYWANLYAQRYQYREAAIMCQTVINTHPKTRAAEMAHYLIGNYFYADSNLNDATIAYRTFIETYPGSAYFRSAFQQVVNLLLRQDKAEEAEEMLSRHLASSPDSGDMIDQLSQVYVKQKRYDDAVRLLDKALTAKPDDPNLLESLGEVYVEKGDPNAAVSVWMRMALGEEVSYNTRQRLGYLFKRNGFYKEAAAQYEAAIELQPAFTYLYTQLAEIHAIQADVDAALDVYVRAMLNVGLAYGNRQSILVSMDELYPPGRREKAYSDAEERIKQRFGEKANESPAVVLSMAELSFKRGDLGAAVRLFSRLSLIHPDNAQLLTQYAQSLNDANDAEGALLFYQTAVNLFPNTPETSIRLTAMGDIHRRAERWQAAVDAYDQAIEADPNRRLARTADVGLVRCLLEGLHQPNAALERLELTKPIQALFPERPKLDLLDAETRIVLGEFDAAAQQLELFQSPDPEANVRAKYLLAEIALRRGDFESAATQYRDTATMMPFSDVANDALDRVGLIRSNSGWDSALKRYVEAMSQRERGDSAGATATCQSLVEEFSRAPVADDARMLLAELLLGAGESETATAAYEAVAEKGGTLAAEALMRLATFHETRNDRDAAVNAYERLLEKYPTGAYAVTARQHLRKLLGEIEG
ncbi:MAG: tetratricopeptide repeat protein, partial [Candidatus Poribacteria bacterium]|nr:tetratricopeptide repeat protein [Candidatus Poribacteria bacterium]